VSHTLPHSHTTVTRLYALYEHIKVRDLCFSPDGSVLASGSDDETLRLWNVANGDEIKAFIGHDNAITSVDYSSNGAWVLTARCVVFPCVFT
jgi:WD40 repeat protein